jgi:hypothetical protein
MTYLITLIIVGLCFMGMAIGLIMAKKALKKGCSLDPDSCACRREGISPEDCEKETDQKSA